MPTLLIAESSEIFTEALTNLLRPDYEIHSCFDGHTALTLLQNLRPDVLIINLTLPYIDGLTVLQSSIYTPPVILALTNLSSNYVVQACQKVGVRYVMLIPCSPQSVAAQLSEMYRDAFSTPGLPDLHEATARLLRSLGVPAHQSGFRQLCIGIPLYIQNPSQRITADLYPTISRIIGGQDWQSVEHTIRNAIHTAWTHRAPTIWCQYFPGCRKPPSNKQFIATLAELIKSPSREGGE